MKIAILGSHGMLAYDIIKEFNTGKGNEIFLYDKHNCDLMHTHIPTKRIFIDSPTPDILINCSGYNSVDKAETDKDTCYAVNSMAINFLSDACNKYGTKIIHFSSDYIFDGEGRDLHKEDSETNPISVYGKSKLLGEEAALKSKKHIVIRTAWLFGKNGKNFVELILDKLKKGEEFKVVNDQFGSPTSTVDLSMIVKILVDKNFNGLIHVTNTNDTQVTWYKFAVTIAELSGYDSSIIKPCLSNEYETIAKRPKYSVLSNEKLLSEHNINVRDWKEALKEYLR